MKYEDISALVDGEVDDGARAPLLDALSADPVAGRTWGRYHVIGDVLRTTSLDMRVADLPAPAARPEAEIVALAPRRSLRNPLLGLAAAASVAMAAILLVNGSGGPVSQAPVLAIASPVVEAQSTPQAVASVDDERDPHLVPAGSFDQRLDDYLVNFNEQRSRLGVPGVHPYVRIVGFDAR